jgi:hypothetical protein
MSGPRVDAKAPGCGPADAGLPRAAADHDRSALADGAVHRCFPKDYPAHAAAGASTPSLRRCLDGGFALVLSG